MSLIFYPKFHCELNYIEMVWGWLKSYHRRSCLYNYLILKRELPNTIDNLLPITFVRKAFRHCLRFMSAYRLNLEGPLLEFSVKKYKSHRKNPANLNLEELKEEFKIKNKRYLSL